MPLKKYFIYLLYTLFFLVITFGRFFTGEFTTIVMFIVGITIVIFNFKNDALKLFFSMHSLLLLWILLSLLWTENNAATSKAIFQIISIFVFTISFVILMKNLNELIKYSTFFMIIVLLLNLIVIFVPFIDSYSYDVRYGEVFHGFFAHKNGLGKAMTIFSIFSLWAMHEYKIKKEKLLYLFSFATALFFIFLSKNSGALGILVVSILIFYIYRNLKSTKIIAFLTLILSVVPYYLIMNTPEWIKYIVTEVFNRDLTFTGRTYIWEVLSYYINLKQYTGYGYQAFWSIGNLNQLSLISSLGFNPTHAHNGIIDTILSIGLVGLGIYLLILIKLFASLIKKKNNSSYIVLGTIIFLIVIYNNILEVDLIYPLSFFYVIQVLIYYYTVIKKT